MNQTQISIPTVNITIDGKPYIVPSGKTVIQVLDEIKADIPRYCYHPGLSIAGNCRICMVEIEKIPRAQIACNTRVAEGMVIRTDSPMAKEARQDVLEFLLINHPLDCPVCDQAGECKLQDYYMEHGQYDPLFNEQKVKKEKARAIGPTIMLDTERCILCSRCVRFTDEITKTGDFGIVNRGDRSEIAIYDGKEFVNDYSGNVADICPVGALTDRDFRFKCRVWYLGTSPSICPGCSRGCSIEIHYDKLRPNKPVPERVMRLKPRYNPEVNKWWICDEGRYGYRFIDENRIKTVTCRQGVGPEQEISWDEAMGRMAGLLDDLKKTGRLNQAAVLLSAKMTNEELFLARELFQNHLLIEKIGFQIPEKSGREDNFLMKADKNPNTRGAQMILGERMMPGESILNACQKGEIQVLVVFGHDLAQWIGAEKLRLLREKLKSLIFIGSNHHSTGHAADLVLPSSVYAEKEGTFTNFEGRVQHFEPALNPFGDSKPEWQILTECAVKLGFRWSYSNAGEIFNQLSRSVKAFYELNYEKIGEQGALLKDAI